MPRLMAVLLPNWFIQVSCSVAKALNPGGVFKALPLYLRTCMPLDMGMRFMNSGRQARGQFTCLQSMPPPFFC